MINMIASQEEGPYTGRQYGPHVYLEGSWHDVAAELDGNVMTLLLESR